MSDGGIQKGYTFWATINIKGLGADEELAKDRLKKAMNDIRKILSEVNGDVIHSVSISKDKHEEPKLSISLKESETRRKRRMGEDDGEDG